MSVCVGCGSSRLVARGVRSGTGASGETGASGTEASGRPRGSLGEPGRVSVRDSLGSLTSGPSGERSGTGETRYGGGSAGLAPEASEPVRRAEGGGEVEWVTGAATVQP